jgi:hypothetical protein
MAMVATPATAAPPKNLRRLADVDCFLAILVSSLGSVSTLEHLLPGFIPQPDF